ncbi:MAG: pentapeptide repeat-containing protein [Gammaproteobacteria bacterium]|nr:pentapeptide repeat-containing protein [Gammaproteobacteria bacterium]
MEANEALELLRSGQDGISEWNQRKQADDDIPNLADRDLSEIDLRNADLAGVRLTNAVLRDANLEHANLSKADLEGANLSGVRLGRTNFSGAQLISVNLSRSINSNPGALNFSKSNLRKGDLSNGNLQGADFSEAELYETKFCKSELRGANFLQAKLGGTDFSDADLREANLSKTEVAALPSGSYFSRSDLRKANLSEGRFWGAQFVKADLSEAHLNAADFAGGRSGGGLGVGARDIPAAKLCDANLCNTNLFGANLKGVDLRGADLSGANLRQANLAEADLRGVGVGGFKRFIYPFSRVPFILNDTHIRNTRFSSRVADPWSVLRRNYTGTQFAFHLLFLFIFLLPYTMRTLFWTGVSRMEASVVQTAITAIREASDDLKQSPDSKARVWADKAVKFSIRFEPAMSESLRSWFVTQKHDEILQSVNDLLEEATKLAGSKDVRTDEWSQDAQRLQVLYRPWLNAEFRQWRVWELLLGLDKGLWYFGLVMVLLIYNMGRGLLTYFVGSLRDEEERSGDSPAWQHYRGWYRAHQVVTLLLIFVGASFLFHAWHWLTAPVLLPG